MIDSQNFEVPDFCATDTRCGSCRQVGCDECFDIANDPNCAAVFGITCTPNNPITCTCHDICVEEVRLIGTISGNCEFTQCFTFPPIGPCRLGAGITLPAIDVNGTFRVFVICAQEVLDSPNCQAINIKIRTLVLAPTQGGGNILLPLDLDARFDTFFSFPDCTKVSGNALQNALAEIDGSCLVIQLRASAVSFGTTTQIVVNGKIIDKLWKHENLWVTGIRPYDLNAAQRAQGFSSFTVSDIFNNSHRIGDCGPIPCP